MLLQGQALSSLEGHSNKEWSLMTGEKFLPSIKKEESGEGPAGQTQPSARENYEVSPEELCVHIMKDRRATRNSQHEFSKGSVSLTSLPALLME